MPVDALTIAWAACEGDGCSEELDMDYDPEVENLTFDCVEDWLTEQGWLYLGDNGCYCPKCRLALYDEEEEGMAGIVLTEEEARSLTRQMFEKIESQDPTERQEAIDAINGHTRFKIRGSAQDEEAQSVG